MTDYQAKYFVMRTARVPALLESTCAEDPTAAEEAYAALELMGLDPCTGLPYESRDVTVRVSRMPVEPVVKHFKIKGHDICVVEEFDPSEFHLHVDGDFKGKFASSGEAFDFALDVIGFEC